MGFISGMVVGIAFGIVFIVAFARHERVRSKHRSDLAKTIAQLARMTVEDSKSLLAPEFYPSWVVFIQRQKLNWLNKELNKIWPFVNEAASELIRTSVEPILEQYKPIILSSLTFSTLTLGTVAPQFTGVSIIEENSGPDGVTLDLEMQWDGDPNIVLDIKTRVGVVLPVQVKNIGFTGVFRLIFKPLVNEFPAFGAVCFSLKEKRDLDFTLKVIGGDLSSLPGVSDAIENPYICKSELSVFQRLSRGRNAIQMHCNSERGQETIRDAIEDSITWPVRKVIPIIPGDYSNLELKPVGILEVKLVQAKNLANKDLIGKSDPYADIFVRPLRARTKTSKIINNQLNPVWNEHFEFIIEDASTQNLTVRIFDDEGIQASELIGCAQVSLKDLQPGKVKDTWLKLVKDLEIQRDNKYRGEVHVELLYCPFGVENTIKNPFDPDFSLTTFEKTLKSGNDSTEAEDIAASSARRRSNVIVRGVLSVTVISAEDLPAVDLMGKADPFVVLMLRKTEKRLKTRVVNESLNPVWNQTFDFVVEDGLHEMLTLEVYDHDTFGKEKIGRVILTLTKVILEGEFTETYPLDGAKSGIISLHLKWTPQHKFRDP